MYVAPDSPAPPQSCSNGSLLLTAPPSLPWSVTPANDLVQIHIFLALTMKLICVALSASSLVHVPYCHQSDLS